MERATTTFKSVLIITIVHNVAAGHTTSKVAPKRGTVLFVIHENTIKEVARKDDNTNKQVQEFCASRLEITVLSLGLCGNNVKRDFRVAWRK